MSPASNRRSANSSPRPARKASRVTPEEIRNGRARFFGHSGMRRRLFHPACAAIVGLSPFITFQNRGKDFRARSADTRFLGRSHRDRDGTAACTGTPMRTPNARSYVRRSRLRRAGIAFLPRSAQARLSPAHVFPVYALQRERGLSPRARPWTTGAVRCRYRRTQGCVAQRVARKRRQHAAALPPEVERAGLQPPPPQVLALVLARATIASTGPISDELAFGALYPLFLRARASDRPSPRDRIDKPMEFRLYPSVGEEGSRESGPLGLSPSRASLRPVVLAQCCSCCWSASPPTASGLGQVAPITTATSRRFQRRSPSAPVWTCGEVPELPLAPQSTCADRHRHADAGAGPVLDARAADAANPGLGMLLLLLRSRSARSNRRGVAAPVDRRLPTALAVR